MDIACQDNVHFYGSQLDIAASQPYAILSTKYVTFMVNRLDAWTKMMTIHPGLSTMCAEAKSIHIQIATAWCGAINESIQNGLFPIVMLSVKNYEDAMSLLKVTCQMEGDLREMIEQKSQNVEEIAMNRSRSQ